MLILSTLALLSAGIVAPEGAAANLKRALGAIDADEIRKDLAHLASDEMKGRDTPSPEQRQAARYIAARLAALEFTPGAQEDSFLWEWSYQQLGIDESAMSLWIQGRDDFELSLVWGEDYYLAAGSPGVREVSAGAIWADEFDAKKVVRLDVKGKWLVGINENGVSGRSRRKLEAAGAAGILLLPPKRSKTPVDEIFGPGADRLRRPRFPEPGEGEDRKGFPVVHVDEDAAKKILAALPSRRKLGGDLELQVAERCGFGRTEDAKLENVVGIWPGSDPKLKKELIILSAHYDHVGVGADGAIYNGADDNASGTSGLLAIAKALTEYGPMRRSIMLMWVSGEEKGLLGSAAWTRDPYLPDGLEPLCNINIDMIGRNDPREFLITPTRRHPAYSALTKVAEASMKKEGFRKIKSADSYWTRSDHKNFAENLDIPVAFLFCDIHEDYHKPTDTPDKIDYDKVRRICRLVVRMLEALQIDEPKF